MKKLLAAQLTDQEAIARFITGGNALFTLQNTQTGNHFTYKVRRPEPTGTAFVKVRVPGDNEYAYFAFIRPDGAYVHGGRKARVGPDAPSAVVFRWLYGRVVEASQPLPPKFAFYHAGRCCKCGRTLTHPESIQSGIGPDCAARR